MLKVKNSSLSKFCEKLKYNASIIDHVSNVWLLK